MNYETVIGLEVHAELNTKTKIYCSCANEFGAEPNTKCCPICSGMPGVLPSLNEKVVESCVKAGLAMNCEITEYSKQDRKNYFYPDLPKAYQISQFDLPLCHDGYVDIYVNGETKRIGITRIHIEEDAGKLIHGLDGKESFADYNRCGVPLIEIVTEPDFRSPEEAHVFLETLRNILLFIGVSDCKMQEGSLRCDVNVSVRPEGQKKLGTRSEMKNVGTFKGAVKAMEFERDRQIAILEQGGTIQQETRRWDDAKGESVLLRSKEDAHDYRYFPEPDIMPIHIQAETVEEIRKTIPELPNEKFKRYMDEYGLSEYDASLIAFHIYFAEFFEKCIQEGGNPKAISNWCLGDISKILKQKEQEADAIPFAPKALVELTKLVEADKISNTSAKKVLDRMFETDKSPETLVEEMGLLQISDNSFLEGIVDEVMAENPDTPAQYKNGKTNVLGFLVGQVMKKSKGKANPQMVNPMIKERLEK
ncbi:Asp-tRNA(Asn)/Glu-tRNA(Gln) amidotransferase subunit GatB [Acetivibrio sp. MSJd-27]|uniref:Asp-tRNA(Asn)/Glu-tRNA(Gln) amidotransferase subunit GatB n=1 Tax=Acetivibrio sp. MSJd-27 TaxID=2841523 RepID=UPI001C10C1BB|nr:Asp-tRNA(Asn)/Glu-tRNA(Gln) amidotransferase subunit GatB [Acetivibrio sp. MSJd-27]MBU5450155.1 Asp-tRNA(Asn)/Glu-tRNA(Gln) amidotransferase subunit GatB [Acetivibrio sp. MSJd-27]